MQFIPEGPDIPEELLNAHADGKVVLFCGAGISCDAGYPLFPALVEELANRNPISDTSEFNAAKDAENYDFALSIIQKKLATNAVKLRRDTADILSKRPKTLKNHSAALSLSRMKDGSCRLITTNFDQLFFKAGKKLGGVNIDTAPKLPIPKIDRWDSVVHLHGSISPKNRDAELGNMVLSSADFGEAYVTDSYCSRFVVELLRNFTVVFIGYSLNDRIMRYLLDAISYSEKFFDNVQRSGHFRKPYAFVEHNENDKVDAVRKWELKEVIPIPYFVEEVDRKKRGSHFRLYDTLNAWADLASGGQNARVTLALNEASKPFIPEDTFGQQRLLWALRDENGKAAEALANVETKERTASIGWLPFFAQNGLLDQVYTRSELQELSEKRQSNTENPPKSKYLGSITNGNGSFRLKPISSNLIRWMLRHLDSTQLMDWIIENGAIPHPEFSGDYHRLRDSGKDLSISQEHIRLWDIITSHAYLTSHISPKNWFDLRECIDISNSFNKQEFLIHIEPKLVIKPSYGRAHTESNETFFRQFRFELQLRNSEIEYHIGQLIKKPNKQAGLGDLCEAVTQLVHNGLDWLSLVDIVSNDYDKSHYEIPSVSHHEQNKHVLGFWKLIFLLRTAFDTLQKDDLDAANKIALQWRNKSYPLFKRLFLYAANKCGSSQDNTVLSLLVDNDAKWLWASETKREVNVYLRERVNAWTKKNISRLCQVILQGPNRTLYRVMPDDEWKELRDHLITKHLAKLEQGDVMIPKHAVQCLTVLRKNQNYTPPDDNSDEFVIYSGGTRFVGWDDEINTTTYASFADQTTRELLVNWNPAQGKMLRKKCILDASSSLAVLEMGITKNLKDESFWSEGIQGLTEAMVNLDEDENNSSLAIDYVGRILSILKNLPENTIQNDQVSYAIVEFWQKHIDSSLELRLYLEIWDYIWFALANVASNGEKIQDSVSYAINNSAGKLTEELFKYLWPKDAKVGGGLPIELTDRIERIVQRTNHDFIDSSSVIVASRAETLFAVDPEFAKRTVLPLLKWEKRINAAAYWNAFLWPARISPDLFKLLEGDCLAALKSLESFQDHTYKNLCQVFLLASMEFKATTIKTVNIALEAMGNNGLKYLSNYIRERTLNSKEGGANYWQTFVEPWMQIHWPRDAVSQSPSTMEDFAMTAMYSDCSFPEALEWMENNGLLGEVPTASTILYALEKRAQRTHDDFKFTSTLVERFPKDVLRLLWLTKPFQWDHGDGLKIIQKIISEDSSLIKTNEYRDLNDLLSQS